MFWDRTLERGVAEVGARTAAAPAATAPTGRAPAAAIPAATPASTFNPTAATAVPSPDALAADGFALVLYPKVGMLDGRHGHNAWLHELPDPVTKVTWDNYACLSPGAAARLGIEDGDIVRVAPADGAPAIELPAFVQPGQHDAVRGNRARLRPRRNRPLRSVGPPWFEARPLTGLVGVNAAALVTATENARQYSGRGVSVARTGRARQLASTQVHHSLEPPGSTERRPIIQEVTLGELTGTAPAVEAAEAAGHVEGDLWPDDHPYAGHRWGMAVDLNSCTGCSACVIACQAENNIPVVGQDEVRRNREMHWIRIDRYYSGTDDEHRSGAPADDVPALQSCAVRDGLSGAGDGAQRGRAERAGLQPMRRHQVLRQQLSVQGAAIQLVRLSARGSAPEPGLQSERDGPIARRHGEVHVLRAAHRGEQDRGASAWGSRSRTAPSRPRANRSCPAQAIVFGDLHDPNSRVSRSRRQQAHLSRARGAQYAACRPLLEARPARGRGRAQRRNG